MINKARISDKVATHVDEAGLLSSIAEGDEQAMARLFSLHSKLLFSIALRVLRDFGSAEDVTQEVFLQIWRSPGSFNTLNGSLKPFLAVVTRNKAIDLLRQRRPTDPLEDFRLARYGNTAEDLERSLMIENVRLAMKRLPYEQSRVLDMAFFRGCTQQEIAAMTNAPLGTVKSRMRSALQVLKVALSK